MSKKQLPIYILVIYFIFVVVILLLQLAGREKRQVVSVKVNERLENAVVLYSDSPLMLKNQKQAFINENNKSQTPVVENGVTYLPISFYRGGFNAIASYNEKKQQATLKYDNKALVMTIGSIEASLSDAERDNNIELLYAPEIFGGDCYIPVRAVTEIFGFELFYDDGLIIISNIEDIFDKETEADSIAEVKALVYNLPAAGSYDMIKDLYKASEESPEETYRNLQTGLEEDLYILCEDEGCVYYISSEGRVVKADNYPYGPHNKISSLVLPTGFEGEKIQYTQGYVCVSGTKGGKAAFCLIDMSGDYGIIRKYVSLEGKARDIVFSKGYFYFCSLSTPSEDSPEAENGFIPTDYENMRYFPEADGGFILNIAGVNLENLSEDALISSFFGAGDEFTFCGSGIYAAETDENYVYGDSGEIHSNVYKLGFNEGMVVFENKTRIEGSSKLAAGERPVFITQNNDLTVNVYFLDSLLETYASNMKLDIGCGRLVVGSERIFLSDSEDIYVFDALSGEFLGSPHIADEKMYLYDDDRIIGFTQFMPEPEEIISEESEDEGDEAETAGEEDGEEAAVYPSVKMTMYNISNPENTEVISEETIENTDFDMFDELKVEMGNGVVILPVKIWRKGTLQNTLYAYSESRYYGLRFQGEI
ncbi:MAG: hypothetical protein LUD81_09910 [Clostridiales bacterium]|nr:hypothetical protein [Clostridiales bacterium]